VTALQQLPVLVVLVPLLAAPLCVLLDRRRLAWLVALAAGSSCALLALLLQRQVQLGGPISYALGGWPPPWGIEYRIDRLNSYVLLVVTGVAALVLAFARHSVDREIAPERQVSFYAVLLLALAGLVGICVTGDAFNLFVFLEISSLASYGLISLGRDRRALTAAFQYLVMGTIGATFILIGIGLLYLMTGTLNLAHLAELLPAVAETRTVRAGLAFLTVGIGLKLALFPLHLWLPNAYAYAPSVVSALLAASATKVALYALIRVLFTLFGAALVFDTLGVQQILLPLAALGVLACSTVAIFQRDLKRLLAYSSVAQVGYMLLGVGLGSVGGLAAALNHLFNHALMKGALFMALGAVCYRLGSVQLRDLAGIGRRMPWTMAAFLIAALSLLGVPLTAGFVSKWLLLQAALERGWWWMVAVLVGGSLLALVYVGRVIEVAYLRPSPVAGRCEAPPGLLLPLWVLALANLWFGVDTSFSVGAAVAAATALLGSAGT